MPDITSVSLYMGRYTGGGSSTGTVQVRLRQYNSDPTTLPSSSTVIGTATSQNTNTWVGEDKSAKTFTFPTPVTISDPGWYCIEVDCSSMSYPAVWSLYVGHSPTDWVDPGTSPYDGQDGHDFLYDDGLGSWGRNTPNLEIAYDCMSGEAWGNKANVSPTYTRYGTLFGSPNDDKFAVRFYLAPAASGPYKATNPSPSDGATNTDGCYDRRLSWNGDANADSHEVFIGSASGSLTSLGSTTNEYLVVPEASFPKETVVYWRVDTTEGEDTVTGDEWNFDPRPTKPTNPTPPNGTGSLTLNPSRLYWDAGDLNQTWNVYLGTAAGGMVLVATGETNEYWDTSDLGVYKYIPLAYGTVYNWRIDAVNVNGTATGDTWAFTTVAYAPPTPSTSTTRSGGAPGVGTFVDGANFIASNRRLIAACANAIFYEPYDED